jgi:hypothetical protein
MGVGHLRSEVRRGGEREMRAIGWLSKAVLLAGALSSAGSAQPITDLPSPCSLLSRLEVEEAAGATVGEGESRLKTGSVTRCSFPGRNGGNTSILIRWSWPEEWVSEQLGRFYRGVEFGSYRQVTGIGERAFLREAREGAVLCVFAGEYCLQVSEYRMGEDGRMPAVLEKLARRALGRLGR